MVLIAGWLASCALAAPALSAAEGDGPVAATSAGAVVAPAQSSGEATASQSKQATHQVTMRDIAFHPKTIHVAVGDTITWVNQDSEPHNAIANDDSFKTATIEQGQTASATIDQAGTIPYFCSIHAGMKATVVAGSGGSGGGSGSSGGSGGSGGAGSSGSGTSPDSFDSGALGGSSSSPTTPLPGATGSGTSGGATGPTSLPMTGQGDLLWLAIAGAWLLAVGAAVRTAARQD
jgi:plastocyanin